MSESSENRRRVANFFEHAKDKVVLNVLVKLDNSCAILIGPYDRIYNHRIYNNCRIYNDRVSVRPN
jgi:hypothetical protein